MRQIPPGRSGDDENLFRGDIWSWDTWEGAGGFVQTDRGEKARILLSFVFRYVVSMVYDDREEEDRGQEAMKIYYAGNLVDHRERMLWKIGKEMGIGFSRLISFFYRDWMEITLSVVKDEQEKET